MQQENQIKQMINTSTNQPYLTVRDLIEMLQQKPQDAKVFVETNCVDESNEPVEIQAAAIDLESENRPVGNVVIIVGA